MIDQAFSDAAKAETVVCFNGGSFLADREIPATVRQYLYREVAEHPMATGLMVESRPEFVRDESLDEAEAHLSGKNLTVAIGLESTNDKIRNGPLAKLIGRKSFEAALRMLKERKHHVFVYVFLGAPGLSPAEAYLDAKTSVRDLHALGVDEIALSCAFVPPGGKLEEWYYDGSFRPPHLWTIARLISRAQENGWPLTLGGFEDFPPPVAIRQNCGGCNAELHAFFDRYRENSRFDEAVIPECSCRL